MTYSTFRLSRRTFAAALVAVVAAFAAASGAEAAGDTIAVGKAVPFAWTFTPINIGVETGIMKKHGIAHVKIVGFGGDAKLQQALLTKDIDFGLASGPGMAFNAKGGGGIAVAAYYDAPRNLGISVPYDSKMKLDDLKGDKVSVSTVGSLTYWLAQRLSEHMGWGVNGMTEVPLGGYRNALSALKTHQIQAMVTATEVTLMLERKKTLKQIYNFADLVPHFITHVIEARKDLVKDNPDLVKRFVAAYFDTVDYMYGHKKETVAISAKVLHQSPEVMSQIYEAEMPQFSRTGRFDPQAVALLKESFITMHRLDHKPADDQLFTTAFLPSETGNQAMKR